MKIHHRFIAFLLTMIFGISISSRAQKIKESDVPGPVKTSFAKRYPGVVSQWEKEDQHYEAGFKMHGKTMSALFSNDGTLLETEITIKTQELPLPVVTYLNSNYKGRAISEAAKITKADGTVNYEAEVEMTDLIFDSIGHFLRKQKD